MFAFNLKVFERVLAVFLLIQCWMLFFSSTFFQNYATKRVSQEIFGKKFDIFNHFFLSVELYWKLLADT